ncbi:hypothetical protein GCM10009332_27660 [Shewanella gelidii]|uniref:Uncharacterized protein n=1 Tax=Shewanella gelidii TaxID=1642821 RepID=A0A917JWM0_9GAMM|nr:hypothetical protein GCM10009332_27660 [Shewanella gelidii]
MPVLRFRLVIDKAPHMFEVVFSLQKERYDEQHSETKRTDTEVDIRKIREIERGNEKTQHIDFEHRKLGD